MKIRYLLISLISFLFIPLSSYAQLGDADNCPEVISATILPQGPDLAIPGNCLFKVSVDFEANGANMGSIQMTLGICNPINSDLVETIEVSPLFEDLLNDITYTWESQEHSVNCGTNLCLFYSAWTNPGGGGGNCGNPQEFPLGGALPVDLIYFKAETVNGSVLLKWQTASEDNNAYFEIQHSIDAQHYRTIASIIGKGTTEDVQNYSYRDNDPTIGENYYRIKQVDYDGRYKIYEAIVVELMGTTDFKVFPNPAYEKLTLISPVISEKDTDVSIYNSSGLLMQIDIMNAGDHKIQFDLSDFPSGIYFIRFVNEEDDYSTRQFVKF